MRARQLRRHGSGATALGLAACAACAAWALAGCARPAAPKLDGRAAASASASGAVPGAPSPASNPAGSTWDPQKTRVFVACLAQFEGESPGSTSFSTDDRNDVALVELFKARGVPADRITFLMDGAATEKNARAKLTELLQRSAPDETLIFYFGSHGGHDPEKGTWWFSTFDGRIPMEWAFESIEKDFKGTRAMLFSDSCYSGGLVELAGKRSTSISYAVLSSTSPRQVAWSGWRFVDVLMRAFGGNPAVDLDGDGHVEFDELARYATRRMAFVAEGRPESVTTGGSAGALRSLRLADDASPKRDARIGELVEVHWGSRWYKAEILEQIDPARLRIHYEGYGAKDDETVGPERVRPLAFAAFAVGARVEARSSWTGKWAKAEVRAASESLHLVRFDATTESYDEWVGPSRVRAVR